MIGLLRLKVYNSVLNITEEKNKFKIYFFPQSENAGNTYEKVRDEIKKQLGISDITATDLQDEIIAPITIKKRKDSS